MTRSRARVCGASGGDSDGVTRTPAGAWPSARVPDGTFFNLVLVDDGEKISGGGGCEDRPQRPPGLHITRMLCNSKRRVTAVRKVGLQGPVGT